MGRYQQEFHQSLAEADQYWGGAAKLIDWYTEPTGVLDRSNPPFYRWFTGGVLNTCFNAVDRHVRDGRGDQPALIYDSPVTGSQRVMTYRELLDEVARFAGVLAGLGGVSRRPMKLWCVRTFSPARFTLSEILCDGIVAPCFTNVARSGV